MKKSEIRLILRRIGLVPRKNRGQNFLASDTIAERIVEAASLKTQDTVVEIGPGLGMVTEKILKTGVHLLAIEIDEKLAAYLKQRFDQQRNFRIITDDFLALAPGALQSHNGSGPPTFITNPPYRGAKKILKRLISLDCAKTIVITLQREVALALVATPGTKGADGLSYMVHYRYLPEKLFDIPQNFFYPEPGIDSTTLLLSPQKQPRALDEAFFFNAVEHLMHNKKKQLKNAIRTTYPVPPASVDGILSSTGLSGTERPAELTVQQMIELTNGIKRALTS